MRLLSLAWAGMRHCGRVVEWAYIYAAGVCGRVGVCGVQCACCLFGNGNVPQRLSCGRVIWYYDIEY